MEMLSLMKFLLIPPINNQNLFNTILLWQQLEQSEELPWKGSIRKLLSSQYNLESLFYEIIKNESPSYLIPKPSYLYSIPNSENLHPISTASLKKFFSIHHYRIEQIKFEYLLFSFLQAFQKKNPRIYKTSPQQCFNVSNSLGLTYLNKLHLDLSTQREHKFCQVFRDSLNPIFNCSNAIESTKH